ncbi:hypothetical protein [Frisingicoccus sp.]
MQAIASKKRKFLIKQLEVRDSYPPFGYDNVDGKMVIVPEQ